MAEGSTTIITTLADISKNFLNTIVELTKAAPTVAIFLILAVFALLLILLLTKHRPGQMGFNARITLAFVVVMGVFGVALVPQNNDPKPPAPETKAAVEKTTGAKPTPAAEATAVASPPVTKPTTVSPHQPPTGPVTTQTSSGANSPNIAHVGQGTARRATTAGGTTTQESSGPNSPNIAHVEGNVTIIHQQSR